MRVLHVASTLGRGGIASSLWHVLPILSEFPAIQPETAVLYEVGRYGMLLAQDGVPSHQLCLTDKYDLRGLPRLVSLLQRNHYDIVHAHGWPTVLFVALASLFVEYPRYVLSEHSVTNRRRRWRLKPLERFIYSRFQHVVAVSQAAAQALGAWLPQVTRKTTVVHNGVDPNRFKDLASTHQAIRTELGLDGNAPLILSSGGLEYHKGIDVLLHALAQLKAFQSDEANGSPVTVSFPITLVAGEGRLRESLQGLAEELNVSEHVRFLGYRADMPALMSAADAFVLSSRWEGCPMVILEAMALGLPIAATAVGGVPELIVQGDSGVLVPSQDPQALSHAVACLLSDRNFALELGSSARERLTAAFHARMTAFKLASLYGQMS